ncbi:hypothetical protein [Prevotella sp. 10(H)]|uniref:hypothetical protein n=1 Tax=Prevotella sp. 10(H) TaxID=1158294 RepID=UPI0004A72D51|nr:hypothetical protein [Prevotella sp. 10(H)]
MGRRILFAIPDDKLSKAFDASVFKGLPKQSLWMTDNNRALLNNVARALQIDFSNNFPLTNLFVHQWRNPLFLARLQDRNRGEYYKNDRRREED